MSTLPFSADNLDRLESVASRAADISSKLFSKWVHRRVDIRMEGVEILPFGELAARMGEGISVGVVLRLESGIEGSLLFLYSESAALELVSLLTGQTSPVGGEFSSLAISALSETGNIVGCAYLNSLSDDLGVPVTPGSPEVLHDHTQSVLGGVLMGQAAQQDQSLFISVDFQCDGKAFEWKFAFLPILTSLQDKL